MRGVWRHMSVRGVEVGEVHVCERDVEAHVCERGVEAHVCERGVEARV